MKFITSSQQLKTLLVTYKAIIIVFADDSLRSPSQLLLNYVANHRLAQKIQEYIFIWKNNDQQVFEAFQVAYYPQLSVLRNGEITFSFIGYNRQKCNQAFEVLCSHLSIVPKCVVSSERKQCLMKHQLLLTDQLRSPSYIGGCFLCNTCKMLTHFEKGKSILYCEVCKYNLCFTCSTEIVLQ